MNKNIQRLRIITLILVPFVVTLIFAIKPQSARMTELWKRIDLPQAAQSADQLASVYRAILAQQPWHADILGELAGLQYQQSDYSAAIQSLAQLSQQTELTHNQTLLLAGAYQQNGEPETARNLWKQALSKTGLKTEEYLEILEAQESNGDWDGAYATIRVIAGAETQDPDIQYRYGLYQMIFDPLLANESLLLAVQGRPFRAENIHELQTVVNEINAEENDVIKLVLAGRGLSNQGEWLLASAAFEKVTVLDPGYAEGWAFLGNTLSYLGKDGFPALHTAQKIDPKSKIVRAYLASYWRNSGDAPASLTILQELIQEEPYEAFWYYETAKSYALNGDLNLALEYYHQALTIEPENVFYWKELTNFCLSYSFLIETEGLTAIRQALILQPEDAEANDLMGVVYIQMNNYSNAERFLLKANRLAPYSSFNLLHLGQLYYLQDENNLAYFYLQNALDYAQNDTIKSLAQTLLDKLQ
jgi:tetratricopeptide (TPR) repeat protein